MRSDLDILLNSKYNQYNQPQFIDADPIVVPHQYSKKQDIEIAGFFAATLAWGLRKTIIHNATRLMKLMDNAPYDFILHHQEKDLKPFLTFAHRTFNATDLLYFLSFLKMHYQKNESLESAFYDAGNLTTTFKNAENIEPHLRHFYTYFFSIDHPIRTHKHVASPAKNSACKRLCMYLRWMVRQDKMGVDFGLWKNISPSQLICPLDVHVSHIAHKLKLIDNQKSNWSTALQLTETLKQFDDEDPSKYDYALFGLGVMEKGRF